MDTINFNEQKTGIISLANVMFNRIIGLPQKIRLDNKKRNQIQIFLGEIGTQNFIFASVYKSPEVAETLCHHSSQDSEDLSKIKFSDSVIMHTHLLKFQASVFGLKSDENLFIAIVLLSYTLKISPFAVLGDIKSHRGTFPDSFSQKGHYINEIFRDFP